MSKITDLEKRRKELQGILKPLAEKPRLDDRERSTWNQYKNELEKVDGELRTLYEAREARHILTARNAPDKDLSRYSLRRAIELMSEKKPLDGIELEMHQEGVKEYRELGLQRRTESPLSFIIPSRVGYKPLARANSGQNVTTAADGGNLVQESPLLFLEALRDSLVLPGMGANYLTGLVGDFPISIGTPFSAEWLAEDGEASITKMEFGRKSLKPKRLQAIGSLTRKLLAQTSADAFVEKGIINAISGAIQAAAINGTGVAPQPLGILGTEGIGSVVGGDNGAAPTWANILELESKVMTQNALVNPLYAAYLTNSAVRGKLKTVPKVNGTYGETPIWERGPAVGIGEINGYNSFCTNAVPSNLTKGNASGVCSALIFGVWDQLFIGQWGGYEVIVDPFTRSDYGEVKVSIIMHADSGLGHPQSFAAMVDVLTDSDS